MTNPRAGRDTSTDLSFLILRAFYNLRGMLDRTLVEHDLQDSIQAGMGPILYALYEEDGCTIREIGDRVQLAPSTLTNTIKKMEKSGLVELVRDESDRRAVRVTLTKHAKQLQRQMATMRREVQSVLHADMSDRQVTQAKSLLLTMIDAMDVHEWESKHPQKSKSA